MALRTLLEKLEQKVDYGSAFGKLAARAESLFELLVRRDQRLVLCLTIGHRLTFRKESEKIQANERIIINNAEE